MQCWDDEVASAPPPFRQALRTMRNGVAHLQFRFPKAYSTLTKGELHDEMRQSYYDACDFKHRVEALRVLYEAAHLASNGKVVVCSIEAYFFATVNRPAEVGTISVRYGSESGITLVFASDGRRVVPCSFHAEEFDRLKPDSICCACGGVTSGASLRRCATHVRCGEEACIASCHSKCEAALSQREKICAKMQGTKAWPFTVACFRSDNEIRFVPVPISPMMRDGGLCKIPSFVAMGLDEDDLYHFCTHARLIGVELATATLRASVCVKRGCAARRR